MTVEFGTIRDRVVAIARRDALIQISYQFHLAYFLVATSGSAFVAYFVSKLVGESDVLSEFDGTYFDFAVLGLALTSYAALGVAAFTQQVTEEQSAGTLEVLLSGPTRLFVLLAGGFIVPLALTTIEVGVLVGLGLGWLGVGLSFANIVLAAPIIALTVTNFCAMGIASAAVILLVKRGDPISGPIYQLTLLLSGAVFPVELFPRWLELISRATPAYYGVRGLREAMLTDAGWSGIVDEIAALSGFALVSVPVAGWAFSRSIALAKSLGVLGSY